MAAKNGWQIDMKQNHVTVTLCIVVLVQNILCNESPVAQCPENTLAAGVAQTAA